MRRLLPLALACLVLAGCAVGPQAGSSFLEGHEPTCTYQGRQGTALVVLMAQVPTASQLPCVELKPPGWTVSDVFSNGRARLHPRLRPGRRRGRHGGAGAVLRHRPSTRVPSDHPGTRRYEEVISIEPGQRYQGAVHYLFPGGCVTYRLDFRSDEQARPLGEVSLALGFVTRTPCARRSRTTPTAGSRSTWPPGSGS